MLSCVALICSRQNDVWQNYYMVKSNGHINISYMQWMLDYNQISNAVGELGDIRASLNKPTAVQYKVIRL